MLVHTGGVGSAAGAGGHQSTLVAGSPASSLSLWEPQLSHQTLLAVRNISGVLRNGKEPLSQKPGWWGWVGSCLPFSCSRSRRGGLRRHLRRVRMRLGCAFGLAARAADLSHPARNLPFQESTPLGSLGHALRWMRRPCLHPALCSLGGCIYAFVGSLLLFFSSRAWWRCVWVVKAAALHRGGDLWDVEEDTCQSS